jgi:hypothetical protein
MMTEQILQMASMSILAGISAGWLADTCVIRRGRGLIVDMGLGVGASLVASSVLLALCGPSAGMLGMLVVGFFLATTVILAQRLSWPSAPGARERKARLRLLELGGRVGQPVPASRLPQVGDGRIDPPRATRALVRMAATGIYLLRGVPLELQRAARVRAVTEGTTLRQVLLKGLGEYAAGTWTPRPDELPGALNPSIRTASR